MGVSKVKDHQQIKIKMPNPSQEPPASSKAPNGDLKDLWRENFLLQKSIELDGLNTYLTVKNMKTA